ncbi:uncharacterized protein LOC144506769 [Mustelus asterias]
MPAIIEAYSKHKCQWTLTLSLNAPKLGQSVHASGKSGVFAVGFDSFCQEPGRERGRDRERERETGLDISPGRQHSAGQESYLQERSHPWWVGGLERRRGPLGGSFPKLGINPLTSQDRSFFIVLLLASFETRASLSLLIDGKHHPFINRFGNEISDIFSISSATKFKTIKFEK